MATRIQKVYGKTPREARQKAEKEFGRNIGIVKTRRISPNKLQPDKGSNYELTIAVETEIPAKMPLIRPRSPSQDPVAIQQAIERVNTALTANAYGRQNAQTDSEFGRDPPYSESPGFSSQQNEIVPVPDDLSPEKREEKQPESSLTMDYLSSELNEIRDALSILLSSTKISDNTDLPDEVTGLYRRFLKSDVEAELAYDLAEAMWTCFNDEEGKSIHEHLTTLIQNIVKTSNGIKFGDTPTVVALVGATGVGKTTTIAKLAIQYCFQKKKVALITTDDFKIGAIEQLETYSQILSLPMEVARDPEELEKKIQKYADLDLILIDTPGRSQLDVARLRSIELFLNAARPDETYLMLNMTTRNTDMENIIKRFGSLGIDKLIFTKLDEAICYGSILNCAVRYKKPIAYFTIGQDVATDIEVATHNRIATFLLRGYQRKS